MQRIPITPHFINVCPCFDQRANKIKVSLKGSLG